MPSVYGRNLWCIAVLWAYSDSIRNMFVGIFFGPTSTPAAMLAGVTAHQKNACDQSDWRNGNKHIASTPAASMTISKAPQDKHLRPQPRLNHQRKEAHAASRTGYPSIKVPAVSTSLIPPCPWRRTLEHNRWLGGVSGSHHHVMCAVSFPHCFFFLT